MKNLRLLSLLMIVASSLLFVQCTSDPIQGPAGRDGIDGIDGVDGIDGADTSAESCISCHSNTFRAPIYAAYETSFHSKGLTEGSVEYAGARASCAQCHSNEGFVDYITKGFVNPAGYYGLTEPELVINDNGTPDDDSDDYPELDDRGLPIYSNNPVAFVTSITCTTCHSDHKSFDFENDGNDLALRALEPVSLMTDGTVIDYGDGSNTCINCHQPRRTGPTDDGAGMFRVTSTHWGPHHGPQATLLEGIQGMLVAGAEAYPGVGSAAHRTGSTCVSCHMGATTDGTDGLHTMIPSSASCVECHSNGIPSDDFLASDMATLAGLLETIGIVHEDHPVPGTYSILEAEAAWNYLLILEDGSKGVHNPKYAKALIKNSIEALQ
ncbi:NapC/NirT family cytochrome c [Maribacter arenosus]|uniref:NapC/NirT family cytochrome c n=1 Tax=Maribacter arenosus TaxID=1854708 RepID=A0ABR7VG55_9FLAO|nr:NapC/NirT family cytochrome c [Maribacter arenosus]MBD0851117.1 NapC/NirT family cytochrome c [Maribacter arenosus]